MRHILALLLLAAVLSLSLALPVSADDGSDAVSADLSVVVVAPPSSGGGNGGGGSAISRTSGNGELDISVPAGTVVRNALGNIIPSYYVRINPAVSPPTPPANSNIIGLSRSTSFLWRPPVFLRHTWKHRAQP